MLELKLQPGWVGLIISRKEEWKMKIILLMLAIILLLAPNAYAEHCQADLYTIKSKVHLRSGPGMNNSIVIKLDHNQTLKLVSTENNWHEVETLSGRI